MSDEETLEALARWGVFASRTGLTAGDYDKVADLQAQVAQLTQELEAVRGDLAQAVAVIVDGSPEQLAEARAALTKPQEAERCPTCGSDYRAKYLPPCQISDGVFDTWHGAAQPQEASDA